MDREIIEGLNIYAKYNVDCDRINTRQADTGYHKEICVYFTGFKKEDKKRLKELGRKHEQERKGNDYYYHEV